MQFLAKMFSVNISDKVTSEIYDQNEWFCFIWYIQNYLFFGSFETSYRTISVNVKYVMIAEYDHDFKPEGGIFYERC